MKKPYTYLALLLLVFLANIPPVEFFISNPSFELWPVMILMAGFFGIFTLFIRTNWVVRTIAIWSFINCFFSCAPYISFTSYVSIVLCCYFYIVCSRIEEPNTLFKGFFTILLLNILLIFMQSIGKDSLLNFGLGHNFYCFGAIGQHMQMGSFSIVLSAVLLPTVQWVLIFPFFVAFFCQSTWTLLAAGIGVFILIHSKSKTLAGIFILICGLVFGIYSYKYDKFQTNLNLRNSRLEVWEHTFQYAQKRPWFGWGPGQYKIQFPVLTDLSRKQGQATYIPFKDAHNWIAQLDFEMGHLFTGFIIICFGVFLKRLYKAGEIACVAGILMILIDGLVHFPDRMIQCVGLIIFLLAYSERRLKQHLV